MTNSSIRGKRVAILVTDGFEQSELLEQRKALDDAGATTPQGMRRQELERLIRAAGREPIERDTLYRPVTRTETSVTVAV